MYKHTSIHKYNNASILIYNFNNYTYHPYHIIHIYVDVIYIILSYTTILLTYTQNEINDIKGIRVTKDKWLISSKNRLGVTSP